MEVLADSGHSCSGGATVRRWLGGKAVMSFIESPSREVVTSASSIGVDVGGTFTDVVFNDGTQTRRAKAPTNPEDFGEGVLAGLALLAAQMDEPLGGLLGRVERFGLGTTAVTNVVTALVGSRVGLITTEGFEEELNLARGIRPSDAGGRVHSPINVVARHDIIGVAERLDRTGRVVRELECAQAVAGAQALVDQGVDVIAVSFMNSYRDPSHEETAARAIREALPGVPVLTGTSLAPTIGFFQRTIFVVLNAFSASSLDGIEEFVEQIRSLGLAAPVQLVNASGGTIGVKAARRLPLGLMHSGPAAGVAAAAWVATSSGISKAIACDMGGTSFDVSMINNGTPMRRLNAEIFGVPTSLSVVDVTSIGAGGGSLGWVDARGMLRVGPESARSTPGPACYGRGGTKPTVTDALVSLGYIDAKHFLGGSMLLDRDAARDACASLGGSIGLNADHVAYGVRRLALADMVGAVRLMFNRRGLDVRDYSIVSYGGCGSLFTADIAAALGVRTVIVPDVASVLSAFGASNASIRHERSRSVACAMPPDLTVIEHVMSELRESVSQDLDDDQVPMTERRIEFEADLSFKRQKFQLTVGLDDDDDLEKVISQLTEDFRAEYRQRYGEGSMLLGAALELVTLRAVGLGASHSTLSADGAEHVVATVPGQRSVPSSKGTRPVVIAPSMVPTDVAVYEGSALQPGSVIEGPACIDKSDTTIWIPEHATAVVDSQGSLVIDVRPEHVGSKGTGE